MQTVALSVRSLSKTFVNGSRGVAIHALRDISLEIRYGEIIGLVGRPGAGKTTLLLALAGLLRPDAGSITWFGEQITGHHVPPGLAYVPQRSGYYSFLTVREALEYYATLHDLSSANRAAQVETALREVALHIHATRRVSSLSSSLLQRLGLAQALVGAPRATLLDETICGEGLLFDRDIVSLLTRLSRRGITIILAAPNPVELHRITARVINLVEGRIVAPSRYPLTLGPKDAELAFDVQPPKRVAEQ
ncbi:MAG TPA: ATP-binding cassette domain-containing protein [Gemmatimonadaceae bacterium]|nr:ATP-binding cassette domain-containing protein [Gemmatimonadaceae bacterium]